jgi:penicillin-binding protein 1A
VTGVWVGNDDNSPLGKSVTGGTLPAQIWRNFMSRAVDTCNGRVARRRPTPSEQDLIPSYVTISVQRQRADRRHRL